MRRLLLACFAFILVWPGLSQANVGDDRTQIESIYGPPMTVDSGQSNGYPISLGRQAGTLWADYDSAGRVVRETVILDTAIPLRQLAAALPDLQAALAAPGSGIFIIRAYPRDELGALVTGAKDRRLFVRFFIDSRQDTSRINTHSRVKAFTVSAAGQIERSQPMMVMEEKRPGPRDGAWRKIENIFQSGLHFSEKLIPRSATSMIVIHHTKVEGLTVASIHDMHLRNGWAGIGYHKVIATDGSIANGRPEAMIGSHALGANRESIGISLVGDYDNGVPPAAQMEALVTLTVQLMKKYNIKPENVVPHRGVTAGTKCPGTQFPWEEFKKQLR